MIGINDLYNQNVEIVHEYWFHDGYVKLFTLAGLGYNFRELLDINLTGLEFYNVVYEFTFEQKQYYLEVTSQGVSLTDKMPDQYLLAILAA